MPFYKFPAKHRERFWRQINVLLDPEFDCIKIPLIKLTQAMNLLWILNVRDGRSNERIHAIQSIKTSHNRTRDRDRGKKGRR